MGAIKNIWKRFKGFIIGISVFLSVVSGVATIAKVWDDIWKTVIAILNFLISTDGRQLILSLLVIGLIILLVRLNRRIRKLSPSKEKGAEGKDVKRLREDLGKQKVIYTKVTQKLDADIRKLRQDLSQIYDKAKKYEQIESEIKPEYIFILETLGANLDKVSTRNALYGLYRGKFRFASNREANISFNMTLDWLEGNDYIRQFQSETDTITHYAEITKNGFKYYRLAKKIIEERQKMIEEEEKKPL